MPWWIIVAVAWGALAFLIAPLAGRFFGLNNPPAPPAGPRARLVQSRENVGVVEILPARNEATR